VFIFYIILPLPMAVAAAVYAVWGKWPRALLVAVVRRATLKGFIT
jgi:hypothetical protein